jgi:hypothetical protein
MDLDMEASLLASNNNNSSNFLPHSSVPILNSSTESIEPQPQLTSNAAAAYSPSIITERVVVQQVPMQVSQQQATPVQVKLENGNKTINYSNIQHSNKCIISRFLYCGPLSCEIRNHGIERRSEFFNQPVLQHT